MTKMKPLLFGKIQSQWENIVNNLNVRPVCDVLMTKLTLLPEELQRINSQVTDGDQARKLLEILQVKGDEHFDNFLAALDRTGHTLLAEGIRQAQVPPDYSQSAYSGATASTSRSSHNTGMMQTRHVTSISDLRPGQKRWRICARLTHKNKISKFKKYGYWDQRFNVSFADDSGSIEAVAFGDTVDKFFDVLEEEKVYYISGATVKKAKSKFSQGNAYDMILENYTKIEPCLDEHGLDLPTEIHYNFVQIDKLFETGRLYDIVGIVKDHELKTIGKWSRIEVQIVDKSRKMVSLTLSMKDVESLDLSGNPVIAVKGAWLKDSNGHIYLKKMPITKIKINPEIPETNSLQRWFAREGYLINFEKI